VTPLISVVISTFDRTRLLLDRTLPSVVAQGRTDIEIIVVGDGPQPESKEALRGFSGAPVRFYELPQRQAYPEDPGLAWGVLGLEARNLGLSLAEGEWIAPLDDDDAWLPNHLELLLARQRETDADIVYSRSEATWADGHKSWYGNWPPQHFAYCAGSEIIRASMGYRFDPACNERGLPEDGDLIDRMVADGRKFSMVPEITHLYYPNRQ
jgi:glycosyltransferase involved in cell wall biosynthesis